MGEIDKVRIHPTSSSEQLDLKDLTTINYANEVRCICPAKSAAEENIVLYVCVSVVIVVLVIACPSS